MDLRQPPSPTTLVTGDANVDVSRAKLPDRSFSAILGNAEIDSRIGMILI
jgi:hypothetical protein